MSRRTFEVEFSVQATVEVDDELLAGVLTDEWRKDFYANIVTPEDVAEHLAFNFLQGTSLENMDGFGDQVHSRAKLRSTLWEGTDGAIEISKHPKKGDAP